MEDRGEKKDEESGATAYLLRGEEKLRMNQGLGSFGIKRKR